MIRIALIVLLTTSVSAKTLTWQTITRHIKQDTLAQNCPTTIYGGCRINKDWTVDLVSCSFYFRHEVKNTIDQEHIVPAERMRKHTGCGQLSRTECRKVNPKFKACHNNRANLFPAVSTINRYRGNLPFTELDNKNTFLPFGKTIGFRKSFDGKSVEPPPRAKRKVGLAYLEMDRLDCIKLSDRERIVFSSWALD